MAKFIFIHLGLALPEYLIANIVRTKTLFPDVSITVISDFEIDAQVIDADVALHLYKRNDLTSSLFAGHTEDNDFWVRSLERIICLAEYIKFETSENQFIHIESDVLLLPNFPIDEISMIEEIVWTRYNDVKDVGSLIYVPNRQSASLLHEAIVETLLNNPGITDMTLLSILSNKLKVANTFSNHLIPRNPKYTGLWQIDDSNEKVKITSMGVFDPAQIGMWLTGMDPRNSFGITYIRKSTFISNGDSEIDPSALRYWLEKDKTLKAESLKGNSFPIWTLHVHSKNLKLFENHWYLELEKIIEHGNNGNLKSWDAKAAKKIIIDNYKKKTLLKYLSYIPVVARLKEVLKKCYNHFWREP